MGCTGRALSVRSGSGPGDAATGLRGRVELVAAGTPLTGMGYEKCPSAVGHRFAIRHIGKPFYLSGGLSSHQEIHCIIS